jgi:hypothetical protein
MTLGTGEFKYEVVNSWPNMPRHWSFGSTSDVSINSDDEIHVFSRGLHPLTVWTKTGDFITSWGEGSFSGQEHGIYIKKDGNIWLVDSWFHIATQHKPNGELINTLGNKLVPSPTYRGEPFNMPTGLAISPKGDIFVSDGYGNKKIHKFNSSGEFIKSWGTSGQGPGEFAVLHNIAIDEQGLIYVCDRENNRIQIFDDEGIYITEWNDLLMPGDIWINGDIFYVVEQTESGGVSIWTKDGDLITRWYGDRGSGKGSILNGHGIAVDSEGSIYVAELAPPDRVRKFQKI